MSSLTGYIYIYMGGHRVAHSLIPYQPVLSFDGLRVLGFGIYKGSARLALLLAFIALLCLV